MGNIYSIGKSALLSANYAINVTSHNISNADTPGYNRQVVLKSNLHGQRYGFGYVGNGTQIDDVRRVYNEFVAKQYVETQSESSHLNTYYNQIQKIDNMVTDETAGVSPALQDFFSSVQEVASTPTSAATREAMLAESRVLVERYNNLSAQVNEQRDLINAQMINSVELINTYATEIAKLNEQICRAQPAQTDLAPNDLLDQRDLLISQLAQEIGVRVVENGNNLDIYIGTGQPLVINNQSFSMYAEKSLNDPDKIEIGYVYNNEKIALSDKLLKGGNLQGFIEYRDNEIDPVLNQLGLIAINLASDFNTQHKLGMDLNGEMGTDFFSYATETSVANASSTASVSAKIENVKDLVASNYLVEYDGTSYRITRQSDGAVFDGLDLTVDSDANVIDGVRFSSDGLTAGDSLTLKPLNDVAESLTLLINDSNKIAAASPVQTGKGENNLGSGKISLGDVTGPNFATSGTLTFQANGTFSTTANVWYHPADGGAPVLYAPGDDVPYEEGAKYDFGDFSFTITGDPAEGDTFYIEPNINGTGDNRNMLALAALQDAKTMLNGTTSYQGAYSQLVNRIGAKTQELEVTSTSTANLLNEIYEEQQSESGVNLDEEAINLMRYQQYYNAASKVIQTANELFDTILAVFN